MKKQILLASIVALSCAVLPAPLFAWGACRSASGSFSGGGSWSHNSSVSGGDGSWNRSGSTSYTNRDGQTYSANSSSSGQYGNGWHTGSGSYSTSGGASGSWNSAGYHSPAYGGYSTYHYGTASYGGCYGGGFGVGYAAPVPVVVPPPVVPAGGTAVVAGSNGVAAVHVGPFVNAGYYRRW